MLCVIPHIGKYEKYHSNSDHSNHIKFFIKTLFHGLTEDERDITQEIFWTEYTEFDNKNDSFDGDEFVWKSKDSRDGNSNLWHQKYPLPCTKVLVFVACRVTSKVLGIVAEELSWCDEKQLNLGKDMLLAVMYQRNILLFIHITVLNQLELNNIILTNNIMKSFQVIPGMKGIMLLVNSWKNRA